MKRALRQTNLPRRALSPAVVAAHAGVSLLVAAGRDATAQSLLCRNVGGCLAVGVQVVGTAEAVDQVVAVGADRARMLRVLDPRELARNRDPTCVDLGRREAAAFLARLSHLLEHLRRQADPAQPVEETTLAVDLLQASAELVVSGQVELALGAVVRLERGDLRLDGPVDNLHLVRALVLLLARLLAGTNGLDHALELAAHAFEIRAHSRRHALLDLALAVGERLSPVTPAALLRGALKLAVLSALWGCGLPALALVAFA